jgi:hypothetical protein
VLDDQPVCSPELPEALTRRCHPSAELHLGTGAWDVGLADDRQDAADHPEDAGIHPDRWGRPVHFADGAGKSADREPEPPDAHPHPSTLVAEESDAAPAVAVLHIPDEVRSAARSCGDQVFARATVLPAADAALRLE